ncbi:MAG: serine/threonine-protein kinase [Myxococcaceae bacterium]
MVEVDPALGTGADPLIGRSIGAYVVKSMLGDGGMAVVFLAEHKAIGRKMAVKVLKKEIAEQSEWHKRFIAEAQVIAALKHRNIVEVFDFGTLPDGDGRQYLMMEYVEGQSLDDYIAEHAPLIPAVALEFADQILNALGEAHKKGIVHRDLKPGNVMVVREHNNERLLKVLDFGLARQGPAVLNIDIGTNDAKTSLLAGTPAYVAPEQALGEVVDGRADLYALGVILFEMVAGRLPFDANDDRSLVQMHVSSRPPSLSDVAQNVPEGLSKLVDSLLAKERENRPATADIARQAVQRVLKQLRVEATAVRAMHVPNQSVLKTDKITRPVAPTDAHSPTTDLELKFATERRARQRLMIGVGVGVVLLLLIAVIAIPTGTPRVVEPAPVIDAGIAVVTPPPEPEVKVPDAAVAIAPVIDEPDPLPEIHPAVDAGRTVVKVKNPVAAAPKCTPDERWKKTWESTLRHQRDDIGRRNDGKLFAAWEEDERVLLKRVKDAQSPTDCAAAEQQLDRVIAKYNP